MPLSCSPVQCCTGGAEQCNLSCVVTDAGWPGSSPLKLNQINVLEGIHDRAYSQRILLNAAH